MKATTVIKHRRRREGKTSYKKRLALISSGKPRLVIRKTLKNITVQFISFAPEGDRVIVTVNSRALKKIGWFSRGNLPTAYLTGLLAGKKALEAGVKDAVLDIGLHTSAPRARIYAALKGVVDIGVNVPHGEGIMPTDDDVSGKRIAAYANLLKKDEAAYARQFGYYLKEKKDPGNITEEFKKTKQQITGK